MAIRSALGFGLLLFIASFSASCSHLPFTSSQDLGVLPIMQGVTDHQSTQLAILVPSNGKFNFVLKENKEAKNVIQPSRVKLVSRKFSNFGVSKVRFENLKENHTYHFEIRDENNKTVDWRTLKTFPKNKREFRFVFASCMDDTYEDLQDDMWQDVWSHQPEMIFFIGDNVYADKNINFYRGPADLKTIWKRYVATRQTLTAFRMRNLIPILATWDDHDYGENDGDRTFMWKRGAKKIFDAFYAQEKSGKLLRHGPGVSSVYQAFGQRFLLLDSRTFRSPKRRGHQTHFGRAQEKWIFKSLNSRKRPTWLISGDQFFGGYHNFDSYQGNHPKSFSSFLGKLKNAHSRVILVSGDRHLVELMKLPEKFFGYQTYEITTSAIHAKTFPPIWVQQPNPYQLFGYAEVNYLLVQSKTTGTKLDAKLTAYGEDKKVFFDYDIEL